MKFYPTDKIRNVALLGQGHSGKTAFAEAMLYITRATDRLGKVAEGTTASDFDAEEINRRISISTSVIPVEHDGYKINFLDTPGYFDFEGEVIEGVRPADSAIIIVSGKSGIAVGTDKAVKLTDIKHIPKAFFISKLDEENTDYFKILQSLKDRYGVHVCALDIPLIENGVIKGVLNVVDMIARVYDEKGNRQVVEVPASLVALAEEYRAALDEAIAETDDELMEKFFAGEKFTDEETKKGVRLGVSSGSLIPVLCGSSSTFVGLGSALEAIAHFFPDPSVYTERAMAASQQLEIDVETDSPTSLLVFKTVADPFVGKMSYFKVVSGNVTSSQALYNSRTGNTEKMGHIFYIRGKKQIETDKIGAGDIGVVTKLNETITGDTLCDPARKLTFKGLKFPAPCLSMAVVPAAKGDEEKISSGMKKLAEEDLTFTLKNNTETHQMVITGMGEMHIDVLVSKLKNKFGTGVSLTTPKVAYREAIRKKVKVEGKHKKQSGGHGQYGHVWIEFEPCMENEGLTFEEKIFGGSVPKNFHPAVEKGLQECMSKGVLAGYPVVNLKATLVDGSYHDVDSSEMAFKVAASLAFKAGLTAANPVLLEPIGNLSVIVPDSLMGDVIGDLNKRRGHVMGMSPTNEGTQIIEAQVPMSEMHDYAIDLRSMTRGAGSFTFDFACYQDAPANIAQKVIAASQAEQE